MRLLEAYKQRFPWVWAALEADAGDDWNLNLDAALPGVDDDAARAQVADVLKWIKAQPLSRRPLVKMSARVRTCLFVWQGPGFRCVG